MDQTQEALNLLKLTIQVNTLDEVERQEVEEPEPQLPEVIYCNGVPIDWNSETGEEVFDKVMARAISQGIYNDINLDEGGYYLLWRDYFRVRGHSLKRSEELFLEALDLGTIPPVQALYVGN